MHDKLPQNLHDYFLETGGQPFAYGSAEIVQTDRWFLEGPCVLEVRFAGNPNFPNDAVRLSFQARGKVQLSDGALVRVAEIHDDPALPRWSRHKVEPRGDHLLVYNAYKVVRNGEFFMESWTGNAGLIVEQIAPDTRRYACSNGLGSFDQRNLQFEVSVLPWDTPLLPGDIQGQYPQDLPPRHVV